jgi:hypothetical protein
MERPSISKQLPAVGAVLTKRRETQIWHSPDEPVGAEGLRADLVIANQLTQKGKAGRKSGLGASSGSNILPERGIRGLIPDHISGPHH